MLTLNCDVKSLFEAQEEWLLLNFPHFKSVTLGAVIRSNGNTEVKGRSTGKKCLKLFVLPKIFELQQPEYLALWSTTARVGTRRRS